ncbi:MAG: NAD(P)/FAD-dependent oxidoreductase [Spirochaetales bacterium]|nr:NAD(P)/FAD-dependent oxidoreductase [Spirochaetales bacterium]
MYDVAIIGAGVSGGFVARELSRYNLKVIVLEKETDVSCGTTKANSAIIHAGYDPEENTLMAKLNAEGNPMFDRVCEELDVPFKRNGSLVVAFDEDQSAHIEALYKRGVNYGIEKMKILSREELREREPNISPDATGALLAETAGIIDPMLLTISLIENAVANGCELKLYYTVTAISKEDGFFRISGEDEQDIEARYVVNAAGVFADVIHNMVAAPDFRILPRRGQYFVLDKSEGSVINSVIFPCPDKGGKGILITPTVHGNILLGPSSDDLEDPEDLITTAELLDKTRLGVRKLIPSVTTRNSIRTFAGMRAQPDTGDFIIREAPGTKGFFDLAGIKSPGLSAAPASAKYLIGLMAESGLELLEKDDFDPRVERKLFLERPEEEQIKLLKENPLYGRIICRCESITEGDILDAIHRPAGAQTLDGVKRRCRPGMGRCQGGFCGPKVQEILARELNRPWEDIVLEKENSYILTGRTK